MKNTDFLQGSTLYVVLRTDLPVGLATAQAVHATAEFCRRYTELSTRWMTTDNRVVVLEVSSEEELLELGDVCCAFIKFFEPDLDNACTAVATMPCHLARKFYTSLPLFGKEV